MLNLLGAFAVGGSIGFVIGCLWLSAVDRRETMLEDGDLDAPAQQSAPGA